MNRILWNRRPNTDGSGGEIDELILDGTVHIEQMSDCNWWISIRTPDGGDWSGDFFAGSPMTFVEQENDGVEFDRDDCHEEEDVSRMMPTECLHGVIVDWGDFGPCQDCAVHDEWDCPNLATCPDCQSTVRPHCAQWLVPLVLVVVIPTALLVWAMWP